MRLWIGVHSESMAIQTDDLVALGLGITGDSPPAGSLQPTALIDGIHIQYRTSGARGFPWFGFYLFRRPHRSGLETCLSRHLREPKEGAALQASWAFPGVSLHSAVKFGLIDEFPSPGASEVALPPAPLEARFDSAPVHRVVATIGFRGRAEPEGRICNTAQFLTGRGEPVVRLVEAQIAFSAGGQVRKGERGPPPLRRGRLGLANALIASPAEKGGARLDIELPVASELVILIVSHPSGALTTVGFDGLGAEIEEARLRAEARRFALITLTRPGLKRLRLESERGEVGVHLAFHCSRDRPAEHLRQVRIIARDNTDIVAESVVSGRPGDTVKAELNADRIDLVNIEPLAGPAGIASAALIDLCWESVGAALGGRWTPVPNYPQPMALPVAESAYPCAGAPSGATAAQAKAMGRIRYDAPANWASTFSELHDLLVTLVAGGPGSGAMNQRRSTFAASGSAISNTTPKLVDENILELLTLASLDPTVAQMLGLYWVDDQVQPGTGYDYLVLADHGDAFQGQVQAALTAANANAIPAGADAWISFNHVAKPRPPLPAPAAPRAYVLPEAGVSEDMTAPRGAVGLGWHSSSQTLAFAAADDAVRYVLWRRDYGPTPPSAPAGPFAAINPKAPYLAGAGGSAAAAALMPANWPPVPLHAVNRRLADGWYGYRLSSICLFGRHSVLGGDGSWWQWQTPKPLPWYYQPPPADKQVNPFAVEIRDMQPPPAPAAVEATALDPADEDTYVRDAAYAGWWTGGVETWWNGLAPAQRAAAVPLRVRWRWYPTQEALHPGTSHFRIYFNPGSVSAGPDPASWQERIFVCPYGVHFNAVAATATEPAYRQYELLLPLLPAPGAPPFLGVPLQPSLAQPVVYANVAVTAANSKPFGADHPKWSGGPWGGLVGIEGRTASAGIYRVWRVLPPAPSALINDDRVWATRADYHSMSFYTHRWPASPQLQAHVYAVMDSTLFMVERMDAAATTLTAADMAALQAVWPTVPQNVVDQLTALRALKPGATKAAWEAACLALGDGALRGLAALPLHEDSYMRQTVEPVDPPDAAGPDDPAGYVPNPAWRGWKATFDGRARNRYFLRAAYIDAAHNEGPMGPPSPPIYLPPSVPPRTPVITRVTGGDRQATIVWTTANAEAGGRYILYRTDNDYELRDVRLMTEAGMIHSAQLDPAKAEAEWTDPALPGGRTYHYCFLYESEGGDRSAPSRPVSVFVPDLSPPSPPSWVTQNWMIRDESSESLAAWPADGVIPPGYRHALALTWRSSAADPSFVVSRREQRRAGWQLVTSGSGADHARPEPMEFGLVDSDADPASQLEYRIRVRNGAGLWSLDHAVLQIRPPSPPPATA